MVGDSAGGNTLALYAAICTNPEYAKNFVFKVPDHFKPKAIALNCGTYDQEMEKVEQKKGLMAGTLTKHKVPFLYRFYGDAKTELGHVFHCNIRLKEAGICNDEECEFFRKY